MKYFPYYAWAFILFVVLLVCCVLFDNGVYHVIKIKEGGKPEMYAIEHCHTIGGCTVYGYRWSVTDAGLSEARDEIQAFLKLNEPTKTTLVE